jgi:hypothetical protein
VDRDTGMVRVHYPVDREQYAKFVVSVTDLQYRP